VTGLKLGREIAVDLKPDADFNQNLRCPCHEGSVLRLALPRTATLPTADIAKEMRYKRPAEERKRNPKLSKAQAFTKAYTDPANAKLAQRERAANRPRA
jgi:hypothetical protein